MPCALPTILASISIARHYADLADQYSEGQLLDAYRRALMSHLDLARRFHLELEPLKARKLQHRKPEPHLCAIRIDRRAVAVAILNGDHLQHVDVRQLSSSPDKALDSAVDVSSRGESWIGFEFASAGSGDHSQRPRSATADAPPSGAPGPGSQRQSAFLKPPKTICFRPLATRRSHSRKELREIVAVFIPRSTKNRGTLDSRRGGARSLRPDRTPFQHH